MSQAKVRGAPTAAIVALVGGVLLAGASFLPWAEVSGAGASVTASGVDGSDGYITLAAGLIAALAGILMLRATRRALAIVAVLAGLVGGGLAAYDTLTATDNVLNAAAEDLAPSFGVSANRVRAVLDQAIDAGQLGVSISIGLYVAMAGGLAAVVGGVLGLRDAAAETAAATPAVAAPPMPPSAPAAPSAEATLPPSPPQDAGGP